MKILEHRALPGHNVHSRYPTIQMLLDISPYEDTPTDEMPHFQDILLRCLPGLEEHRCSPGRRGGFIERLRRGTWLGHVTEHVAIELQCMAGIDVGFGKTRQTSDESVYSVAYRYRTEEAGLEAGRMAVAIVEAAAAGQAPDVGPMVERLRRMHRRQALGPSTRAIVDEARRRDIPVMRLNDASHIQLGHGAHLQRIQASLTGQTSCLGAEVADDKLRTKQMLASAGIPVPRGMEVRDPQEALAAAQELGYPVVVKPLVGNHGRGITTGIGSEEALWKAMAAAQAVHPHILVEEHLEGGDFRVLVVGHRFVAAAQRVAASVVAEPGLTVRQLIEMANADPRRGEGHESVLTRIPMDEETARVLAVQGLTLDSVPSAGQVVRLRDTANLSTGGTSIDVTDEVHPEIRRMCERASRLVGLDIMGIDIVAPDLRHPLAGRRAGIVEVNAAPGLRMHTHPTLGRPRDVAAPIVRLLFPEGQDGRIPIIAVTGTNGKTTTVRLTAHILREHGARVGVATTDGVLIGPDTVMQGDYAGPAGAQMVLQDPWVDHAVLEVARGGILRRGLGFDHASVGVFLNVARDHLGAGGVESLQDLAHVKSVVVESVREDGWAVLNAQDPHVMRCLPRLHGRPFLFAVSPHAVAQHVRDGGSAVTVEAGHVVWCRDGERHPVARVDDIPLLMGGAAPFNLENALAATAATLATGLPVEAVRRGLETFRPTPQNLPGRVNLVEAGGVKVLVDYGHNPAALEALTPLVERLAGHGRRLCAANASGNRLDEDLRAFGRGLATLYDHIVLSDCDPRGRPPGQTSEIVWQGMQEVGADPSQVQRVQQEEDAIRRVLSLARKGDLVVVQADNVAQALALVQALVQPPKVEVGRRAAPPPQQG